MTRSWSSILWLVQTKLQQEDSIHNMAEVFRTFGLNWGAFPLPPYVGEVPVFPWDGVRIYYGSTKLIQLIHGNPSLREGAAFFYSPETHSVSWYGPRFGGDALNAQATKMKVGDLLALPDSTPDFFVRPETGVKLFSGQVLDIPRFRQIVDQKPSLGPAMDLDMDTIVHVNEVLPIEMELRTWWIGGKIAAIVGYRRNGRVDPWTLEEDEPLYGQVKEFALAQGEKIREVGACVLDVALTPQGLKVVEINCIHTSGFYCKEVISEVVVELTNFVREHR